ncbi:MAG: insulinase family protein [Clostridia bacterium]|nr:insulinase family protein [Clostridia bacterium]
MKINDIMHGFKLLRIKPVAETGGELWSFRHLASGADLIWSKREDDNKTFSIAFKTTPDDDTGVFHILEHSVLCGSEKYPVKDPFVKLLQTSMQTFLNAMTYPDKTVYPISSRNDKDFMNLADVYLDAVFHPGFLKNPGAFLQEGRHYEVDENGEPSVQGVVFSEMQGVFADPQAVVETALNRRMFSQTCYRFRSGGYPEAIPDLTYEKFIEVYKRYYHPSNSIIQVDGSVDIDAFTEYLDREYLSAFSLDFNTVEIKLQDDLAPERIEERFSVSESEKDNPRDILVLGRIFGDYRDLHAILALELICDYLCSSNESPLRRAVLNSGLAEDIKLDCDGETAQCRLIITAENCRRENFDELHRLITDTITAETKKGFDKDELKAYLSEMVFSLNEPSRHRGLEIMLRVLQSRLYGGDPETFLEFTGACERLKAETDTDYFEKLAAEAFDDSMLFELRMLATPGLDAEQKADFDAAIRERYSGFSAQQKELIAAQTRAMYDWQTSPDSAEAMATLPVLQLSDVDPEPIVYIAEPCEAQGVKILRTETFNDKITYMRFYFELSEDVAGRLFEMSLMSNLFTNLPTASHSVKELQRLINLYLGSISFDFFPVESGVGSSRAYFVVNCCALNENADKALGLVREIILTTDFSDKTRINETAVQLRNSMRDSLVSSGHRFASCRAGASVTSNGGFTEQTVGYTFYEKIKSLTENFDASFDALAKGIGAVCRDAFARERFMFGCSGRLNEAELAAFAASLPEGGEYTAVFDSRIPREKREGIVIPGNVSYASLADNLDICGSGYGAASLVASHYLTYEYLWNEIRVRNGAYGTGLYSRRNGNIAFYSYRDPNAANSVRVFCDSAGFLAGADIGEEELGSVKIGAISALEPLLNASQKCSAACDGYIVGKTRESATKLKRDIMELSSAELSGFSAALAEAAKHSEICVVGPESVMESCGVKIIDRI